MGIGAGDLGGDADDLGDGLGAEGVQGLAAAVAEEGVDVDAGGLQAVLHDHLGDAHGQVAFPAWPDGDPLVGVGGGG